MSDVDLLVPYATWRTLTWRDVDPSRMSTPDRDRAVTLALDALQDTPRDEDWMHKAEDEIALNFARAWGPWTCGWRYAASEDGGVTEWSHSALASVMPGRDHDRTERDETDTARLAADALIAWHGWLNTVATLFEKLDHVVSVLVAPNGLAVAATRIVEVVVERTTARDAWYATCAQTLCWFLEHQGIRTVDAHAIVERAIGGVFESWVAPSEAARDRVTGNIGAQAWSAPQRRRDDDE